MLLVYFRALNSELQIWVKHQFIIVCEKCMPCRSGKHMMFILNPYNVSSCHFWWQELFFRQNSEFILCLTWNKEGIRRTKVELPSSYTFLSRLLHMSVVPIPQGSNSYSGCQGIGMPGRNTFRIDLVEYRIRGNLGPPDRCLLVLSGYSVKEYQRTGSHTLLPPNRYRYDQFYSAACFDPN